MIDTVHIKLNTKEIGNLGDLQYCEVFNNEKSKTPNITVYKCCINNLNITCKVENGSNIIRIKGSLQVFYKGHNLGRFNYKDVKNAFETLSEKLEIDLMCGVVTRIDFGANIPVKRPPELYNLLLDESPNYLKDTYGNYQTVTFRKQHIALSFYNKIKQLDPATKKIHYASIKKNKNVIRYEIKLFKRLAQTLKLDSKELLVRDLMTKKIYVKLVKLWYKQYRLINKFSFQSYPNNYKRFGHYLESAGVHSLGGFAELLPIIEVWSKSKRYPNQCKNSLKNRIRDILKNSNKRNAQTIELSKKIKKIKERNLKFVPHRISQIY